MAASPAVAVGGPGQVKAMRAGLVVVVVGLAAVTVIGTVVGLSRLHEYARGRGIYEGSVSLPARVDGQDFALPVQASRCVNCHALAAKDGVVASAPGVAPSRAAAAVALGPALTPAHLREMRPRRGGPPSRYDPATMCRLLRSGVDPAYVMITRAMPRFDVSDDDCAALWRFLG